MLKISARFVALSLAMLILLSGCSPSEPATQTLKVGSSWPMTGSQADYGKAGDRAVRLALQEANKRRIVIDGKRIEFQALTEDDAKAAKRNPARSLVDRSVIAVIGHPNMNLAGQASAVYRDALIPFIAPTASFTGLTKQGYDNIFRLVANDNQQALVLADYIADNLFLDRTVILTDRTVYGRGVAEAFERQALERGAKILIHDVLSTDAAQTDVLLDKVKTANPQLVFFGGILPAGGLLAQALDKRGLNAVFTGVDAVQSPGFVELGGASAEGSYATRGSTPLEEMPDLKKLEKKLGKIDKEPGASPAPFAYDAASMLVKAIENCECVKSEEISDALHELKDFKGVTGRLVFDEAGDLTEAKVTIYQVKAGKWVRAR